MTVVEQHLFQSEIDGGSEEAAGYYGCICSATFKLIFGCPPSQILIGHRTSEVYRVVHLADSSDRSLFRQNCAIAPEMNSRCFRPVTKQLIETLVVACHTDHAGTAD